ncbi:hypothetical protein GFS31_24960 [Leptolyngbya sp. BL0902]|uniref:hypothetical protein n=1 Tax=Leptolyngbya sp. BL0902 TaxID=1115757 RepID=UPI0018E8B7C6|nr:hypothetical protein [Leptolyngbya sp. BL0902]QQE65806.1 hypothetical protein GFS31_24960 [Leptolyngbya sp. BL0902]
MNWTYMAGGGLALWLLSQGSALANLTGQSPNLGVVANSPAAPEEEALEANSQQPSPDDLFSPFPWADLLDGDLQQPLRVGEYNRITARMWRDLNDQRALRSDSIQIACDALGSDMRYLRGRVPRQIEDAYRQMAPFQTKGLTPGFAQSSVDSGAKSSDWLTDAIGAEDYTEAEAILELIRSGEDPHLYETYRPLFSHFLSLNLDDYLDPTQDDAPLSRSEFLGYIEILHQTWQDPTGGLERHERFLAESDRLIQELLTMLREVRRSLATLEATKTHASLSLTEIPQQTVTPVALPSSPSALYIAQSTTLNIDLDEEAFVTRRAFLLAMIELLSSVEIALFQYIPWCGDYRVENEDNLAQEMQWEVDSLIRDLDTLNFEILELVNTQLR